MDGGLNDGAAATENAAPRDPTVRWFWLFVLTHVAVWTLAPTLSQPNAPLDTIEMLSWGHEWQLGYYKHPPIPAWYAEAVSRLGGSAAWPTYLASQICVAVCFWAAWRLGRELLDPASALCGAAMLEGCYYYNYTTPELNNSMLSRMFWALSALLFYWALKRGASAYWIALGASLALGLGSKYYAALPAFAMLTFLIVHPTARRAWRTPGPYLTMATIATCFGPHLVWLVQNEFPTIAYVFRRSSSEPGLLRHLTNPASFAVSQLLAIGPMLLVAAPLLVRRRRLAPAAPSERRDFDRWFLAWVALGPPAMVLFVSLVTGAHMRSMWGAPMWSLAGVVLLFFLRIEADPRAVRRTLAACAAAMVITAVVLVGRNVASPYLRGVPSRVHFPGEGLAQEVERRWDADQRGELKNVAGPWWMAGNAAFYGSQRATVYIDMDPEKSPWMSDERLREQGGVILWRLDDDGAAEASVRKRFPTAEFQAPIELAYRSGAALEPLRVGIAVAPPSRPAERVAAAPSEATR